MPDSQLERAIKYIESLGLKVTVRQQPPSSVGTHPTEFPVPRPFSVYEISGPDVDWGTIEADRLIAYAREQGMTD